MSSRGNMESGTSAIRLSELGPRLTLQLIKIEDGLLDGEVLYHDLIHKSEDEKVEIQKLREKKKKLKEKRKKLQEANRKAKDEVKQQQKEKSLKGMQKGKSETDVQMLKSSREANREAPVEEDDDREYYRKEVGEEPDKELFSTRPTGLKRKFEAPHFKNKRAKLESGKEKQTPTNFSHNKGKKRTFDKGDKFKGDKKFKGNKFKSNKNTKGKGRGVDKTNSHNRDHRPIGGKTGKKKFKGKNRK